MKTAYDVLDVPWYADDDTIRAALRRAAKAYHPDVNAGDTVAVERLRRVIAAYEMLRNPKQRAAYDEVLRRRRRDKVRRFATTAITSAGLVSASTLALMVWLAKTQDSVQAPGLAAAELGAPASQQPAAADHASGPRVQQDDSGHDAAGKLPQPRVAAAEIVGPASPYGAADHSGDPRPKGDETSSETTSKQIAPPVGAAAAIRPANGAASEYGSGARAQQETKQADGSRDTTTKQAQPELAIAADSGSAGQDPAATDRDVDRRAEQDDNSAPDATRDQRQQQALLAKEWEGVQASRDLLAIWAFAARNPEAPEAELARSSLMGLIDAAEDGTVLRALRSGAIGAIAEAAQQRLIRLGAVAKPEDTTVGAGKKGGANIAAAPSNDPVFFVTRGLLRSGNGDFDQAIADFDQAIRLEPGNALTYIQRAGAWGGKGNQDRALADFETAIRIDPDNPNTFRDRGILWRRSGALDRALVDFDQAIRLGFSDARAYNERGLVWYAKGRHDRAIADFNQAIKIDPELAAVYINRGIALRSKGDLDRAAADFDQAIRIDPSMSAAYYR